MATNSFGTVYGKVFGGLDQNLKHLTVFEKLRGRIAHNALSRGGMGKAYNYDNVAEGQARTNTRGADNTIQTFTPTLVTLTIDKDFEYSFTQNAFDGKLYQNAGDFIARQYNAAEKQLVRAMDGDFLGEISKAGVTIDDGDVGGSAGDSIVIATRTAKTVLAQAKAKVANAAGSYDSLSLVVSPDVLADFEQEAVASGFNYADSVLRNGFLGTSMQGVDFFVSQYVTHSLTFTITDVPTNADTLVLLGNTITAVSTIGTTAGNVLIDAGEEEFIDNCVTLINAPTATTATGVAIGAAASNAVESWQGLSAAKSGTTKLVLTFKRGKITYTDGLTNSTAGTQEAHCYLGQPGEIELANPIPVTSYVREESKRSDTNYLTEAAWGVQVPTNNRQRFGKLVVAV